MAEIMNQTSKKHSVNIVYNEYVQVDGVKNVLSYDDKSIELQLSDNCLMLQGSMFDVKSVDLENERVIFNGRVSSLSYANKKQEISLVKRIFK